LIRRIKCLQLNALFVAVCPSLTNGLRGLETVALIVDENFNYSSDGCLTHVS